MDERRTQRSTLAMAESPDPRLRELTAYCALLRGALRDLVQAVHTHRCDATTPLEHWTFGLEYPCQWAEMTLTIETARHAEQIVANLEALHVPCATVADYTHQHLYGRPRVPSHVPITTGEAKNALNEIHTLCQENLRLYGLLTPPPLSCQED